MIAQITIESKNDRDTKYVVVGWHESDPNKLALLMGKPTAQEAYDYAVESGATTVICHITL